MFYEYHMKDFNLAKAINGPIAFLSFFLCKNSKLILLWEKWVLRYGRETLRNKMERDNESVDGLLYRRALRLNIISHPCVVFHYVSLFRRRFKLKQRFFQIMLETRTW